MNRQHARALAAADQANAQLRDERAASPDGMTASERAMANSRRRRERTHTVTTQARLRNDPDDHEVIAHFQEESAHESDPRTAVWVLCDVTMGDLLTSVWDQLADGEVDRLQCEHDDNEDRRPEDEL